MSNYLPQNTFMIHPENLLLKQNAFSQSKLDHIDQRPKQCL